MEVEGIPEERVFLPGMRVRVFDYRLYKDDVSTPGSVTRKEATVVKWYGYRSTYDPQWIYPSVIDVVFDHDGRTSRAHFTYGVEILE